MHNAYFPPLRNVEEPQLVSPKQQPPASPVQKEVKDNKDVKDKTPDQFDGVDVSSEKLSHPTANRAKPPQRRPPTALATAIQVSLTHRHRRDTHKRFRI